jgi:hypothetical protein
MGITVQNQPAMGVIAGAGFAGGQRKSAEYDANLAYQKQSNADKLTYQYWDRLTSLQAAKDQLASQQEYQTQRDQWLQSANQLSQQQQRDAAYAQQQALLDKQLAARTQIADSRNQSVYPTQQTTPGQASSGSVASNTSGLPWDASELTTSGVQSQYDQFLRNSGGVSLNDFFPDQYSDYSQSDLDTIRANYGDWAVDALTGTDSNYADDWGSYYDYGDTSYGDYYDGTSYDDYSDSYYDPYYDDTSDYSYDDYYA